MKPGFALSLSFDGISLLHRAAGGWRLVGEVALDAADLASELAGLRHLADRLEPGELACKLIIPNDQIRYFSVETGPADDASRQDQVLAALDGATPYAVEDLAYDVSRHGDVTHVAAIARETLDEAEAFATEHDFNPVSFVAIPGDQPFLGEPHFGPARRAADLDVTPDGVAVVVVGQATIPSPPENPNVDPDPAPTVPEPVPGQAPPGFSTRRSRSDLSSAPTLAAAREVPDIDPAAPVAEAVAIEGPTIAGPSIAVEPDEPPQPVTPPEPEPLNGTSRPVVLAADPRPVPAAPVVPAPAPKTSPLASDLDPEDETSRMTIFGARPNGEVGGKPRYLGLALTAALLVFLLIVAAWATGFSDLRLFDTSSDRTAPKTEISTEAEVETRPEPPETVSAPEPEATVQPEPQISDVEQPVSPEPPTRPDPGLSDPDIAQLDSLYSPTGATADPDEDEQSADAALLQGDLDAAPLPEPPVQLLDPAAEPDVSEGPELAALVPQDAEDPDTVTPKPEKATSPRQPLDDAARYAATGIWSQAPDQPGTPGVIGLSDLYTASIDRTDLFQDAVALPPQASLQTDNPVPEVSTPVAPENTIRLDPRGLVDPSPDGTLNPDGILIYEGRPSRIPPDAPRREEPEPDVEVARDRLAGRRPRLRPDDLIEQNERAQLGGRSLAELAAIRPRLRPANLVRPEEPDATEEDTGPPTAQAVAISVKPKLRPASFAARVNKERLAAASTASIQDVTSSQPVLLAPKTVTPKIPSSASVARQATVKNTINLRKVNLIGVYGSPSNRRALVRLPSGRYKKVKIGDSVDGGRVVAIGDSELRYQKGGRNVTLKMPKG